MNIEQFPIQPVVEQVSNNFEKFSQSEKSALDQAVAESENQAEAMDLAEVLVMLTKKSQELMADDSLSADQKSRFQQAV